MTTRKYLQPLLQIVVVLALCRVAVLVEAARLPGDYMNEMWTGYETPHISWAKPYSRGKVKAFFIAPFTAAREVAELAQRLDLDVHGEATFSERILGGADHYTSQVEGTSPTEKLLALRRKLRRKYDVIVLANFDYALLPTEIQYWIAKAVTEGTGLVEVYRRNLRSELLRYPDEDGAQRICAGIPFGGLTFYRDQYLSKTGIASMGEIPTKLVETYRVKKGRLVRIDFGIQSDAGYGGFCLTPREYFTFQSQAQYEYHQMLAANAVLWAAQKEPLVKVQTPAVCSTTIEQTSLPIDTKLALESELTTAASVTITIRNPWGEVEHEVVVKVNLAVGENSVSFRLPHLAGGGHFLDVRVNDKNAALGWSSFWLTVRPLARIAEIKMDKLSFERTEQATGIVKLAEPCREDGYALSVHLLDNYQRLYAKARIALARGANEARFSVPLDNAVSLAGRCRARLMKADQLIHQGEAEFFIPKRELDVFPTLLWGTFPGILGHFLNNKIREAGFNTILLPHYSNPMSEHEHGERRRISAVARDDMIPVPYTTHITGWPSLSDDALYQGRREQLLGAARFLAPYGPLVYSLGDENSIREDVGFQPTDRPGFIAYLKREYGALDDLNAAWGAQLQSWDEAAPVRTGEAREKHKFAQYHDTETYREELYARWHHWHNDLFREIDPYAKVGSEGSISGDLEKTIHGLEFWGPYRRPEVNALLRSLAPRSLIRGNWFGGYVHARRDVDGLRRFLWDTFLDGSNLFEIYCCYTSENIFNNDLTFGYWTDAFFPDLKEIVDGIGQLVAGSEHDNDPVAIYHSQPSVHAARLHSPFGSRRDDHVAGLTLLSDAGLQPYYVTSNQVKDGALRQQTAPKLLFILCEQALSDEETRELTQFVERGGVLIADIAPGVMDGHCALRGRGALDDLFGVRRTKELCLARKGDLQVASGRFEVGARSASFEAVDASDVTVDAAVSEAGGRPLGKVADTPTLIANRSGKGLAVLLNMALRRYGSLDPPQRASLRDLVLALAWVAGVEPFARVLDENGAPLLGCRLSRFRRGSIVTLGILTGRPSGGTTEARAVLRLRQAAHVYDQRSGKYHDQVDAVPLALNHTSATMLSILPYRVNELNVAAEGRVSAGSPAAIGIAIRTDGAIAPEGHVYRVRIRDPHGDDVWRCARTARTTGRSDEATVVKLPFAYNAPEGEWTITVRDVATRMEKAVKIRIRR